MQTSLDLHKKLKKFSSSGDLRMKKKDLGTFNIYFCIKPSAWIQFQLLLTPFTILNLIWVYVYYFI